MIVETGVLTCIDVEYARQARYRKRLQALSHRAPRYLVRYRLGASPITEVVATAPLSRNLIAGIRGSRSGDHVEVWLSDDGVNLLNWNNLTAQRLYDEAGITWDESD
jgi:hypothetical protein